MGSVKLVYKRLVYQGLASSLYVLFVFNLKVRAF